MKLGETSLPQQFATEYETTVGPHVIPEDVITAFKAVHAATADFLADVKRKNQKVCLNFVDAANNFIMAAIVKYNKNEEEGQDNWNYYFTFNEDDIKDVPAVNRHNSNETPFHSKVTNRLYELGLRITDATYISPLISMTAKSLSLFLDQNVKPGEEVILEEDGYFVASVKIEDDQPVKSLIPGSDMKIIIKQDDATQKAA